MREESGKIENKCAGGRGKRERFAKVGEVKAKVSTRQLKKSVEVNPFQSLC